MQDITHTNTHTSKKRKKKEERKEEARTQYQAADRGHDIEGAKKRADNIALCPAPFTDTVPRTEKAALDQKRASEIASQQVCRETSASSSSSVAPTPAPPSRKGVRDHTIQHSGSKNYDRSVHKVQSRSTESSMHSLAHVYRLLPQLVSKASTPSATHLHNRPAGQRAVP